MQEIEDMGGVADVKVGAVIRMGAGQRRRVGRLGGLAFRRRRRQGRRP